MIIIILSLIDPDPVTRLNEIPGAAKLGKIYHFVWSRGNHSTALVTGGEGADLSLDKVVKNRRDNYN